MRHARLIAVLEDARTWLCLADNDFAWSGWGGADDAATEIDGWIERLKAGTLDDPRAMRILFAPTGPIQEVSLSSGWGEDFLRLAAQFDRELEKAAPSRSGGP